MHRLSSSFILGYHGCDRAVADRILAGAPLTPSQNDYDWLGHGIYFWEANPKRGLAFARDQARRPRGRSRISSPAVIGAVIDLGNCLDLTTLAGIDQVRLAYAALVETAESQGRDLPRNHPDGLRRHLDCAVINLLADIHAAQAGSAAFQTVKGVFIEGSPVYADSGFFAQTHIQICVRDADCIKGVFRVREADLA